MLTYKWQKELDKEIKPLSPPELLEKYQQLLMDIYLLSDSQHDRDYLVRKQWFRGHIEDLLRYYLVEGYKLIEQQKEEAERRRILEEQEDKRVAAIPDTDGGYTLPEVKKLKWYQKIFKKR